MKLKLDENIGQRGRALLEAAGHDVMTVRQQGLGGATDDRLFTVCRSEGRVLITLDHDFGQTLRFPPEGTAGVVVLEPGPRATTSAIVGRLREFLRLAEETAVSGNLWIVEPGRIRIRGIDA